MWLISRLFWRALAGALIAVLAGGSWYAFSFVQAGESLTAVPLLTMVVDVMRLHLWAAWGAAIGIALGLLGRVPRLVRRLWRRMRGNQLQPAEHVDADALIQAERSQKADEWLAQRKDRDLDYVGFGNEGDEDAPDVENIITAMDGKFTYRILAYRHLSHDERKQVVRDALRRGHISEPEPGGTATLVTLLGRRSTHR